jgi:hypothetical protein
MEHNPALRDCLANADSQHQNKNFKKSSAADIIKLRTSDVNKFQTLYAKHFDQRLDVDEAHSELTLLVRQLSIIYQPISAPQLERLFMKSREA